ncbi:MAG: ATP-grasp domain-containing protein [Bacteroidetes bacterium]|nr:ATP-grasp domain-containing protein [Bacteroidota bacterium]
MTKITKILIANRGEIAVRIMRTARKMGIHTVSIFAENDISSLHVKEADEARLLTGVELSETYLNIAKIVETALETGCDAIHPGYGFLAENPLFVEACDGAGIIFIGPKAEVMRVMGNKIKAREFVKKAGVPVTEGLTGNRATLLKAKSKIGFPVLLKAAAGGGGKGMQIVREEKELEQALEATSRQALAYFGDDTIYLEKYLDEPRHIEFQILGDNRDVIHLFERECSIQRRYQKIIEESPSPTLTPELRKKMGEAAVRIGKEIGYTNAGTIEFLVDRDLNFYFLEMNTRIQVEHPVTEMVTGTDLVEEQILVAEGKPLRIKQETLRQNGHAIECRIYAEDPENNFMPSPGKMTLYKEPVMDSIRIDKGITSDSEITSSYDPMICKLVSWGSDREDARKRMTVALQDYQIHGIRTNIAYLSQLLISKPFITNTISTKFCDEHTPEIVAAILNDRNRVPVHFPLIGYLLFSLGIRNERKTLTGNRAEIWNTTGFWREEMMVKIKSGETEHSVKILSSRYPEYTFRIGEELYFIRNVHSDKSELTFSLNGISYAVYVSMDSKDTGLVSFAGHIFEMQRLDFLPDTISPVRFESAGSHSNEVYSPMPGKVIKLFVKAGDKVGKGEVLLILEAMKMENSVVSPADGIVEQIHVAVNDRVDPGKVMVTLEKKED